MKSRKIFASILLFVTGCLVVYGAIIFKSMWDDIEVFPSENLTSIKMLSDYFNDIEGGKENTEIYVFEGDKKGASILILGGTHGNEPAGYLTAITILENINVNAGTVYVIPFANRSNLTHNDPQEASPQTFTITTKSGEREFKFGSRATNPIDQWPDPEIYIHASSGQKLSGSETRNLNRAFPGKPNGTFTERIAYGITEFIKKENITIVVDLHESSPEYPVINALVAHEEAMDIATRVIMSVPPEAPLRLEPSPVNLRGLSHRELGDFTDTYALLLETANPSQGRLRGRTDENLVLTGIDPIYVKAAEAGRLYVSFDENGHPIDERVGRHLESINQIILAHNDIYPDNAIIVNNLPVYNDLVTNGIGVYLK